MNKNIIISLGIIGVLVLYLVLVDKDKAPDDVPELDGWDKEISEILIDKKGESKINLMMKDGKWVINNEQYPGDMNKIGKMETKMKELKLTDLVSKGPYYDKYELTPDKSFRITVKKDDDVLRDILLGKKSSTSRNTYVKFPDKEEIYLASGNLIDEYDKDVEDLRDKEIYKLEKDSVNNIELKYLGKKLTFEKIKVEEKQKADPKEKDKKEKKKEVEKWICEQYKKTSLAKNKVESLINSFRNMRADSYPEIKKKSLKSAVCTIMSNTLGKDIILKIHKKDDEDNYLCTSSESPYVFTIREYNAKKFFKKIADFKEEKKKK